MNAIKRFSKAGLQFVVHYDAMLEDHSEELVYKVNDYICEFFLEAGFQEVKPKQVLSTSQLLDSPSTILSSRGRTHHWNYAMELMKALDAQVIERFGIVILPPAEEMKLQDHICS